MKQYIRKADIILFIVLVVIGLAASFALSLSRTDAGADAKVIIESGGDLYATYPLSEDRTVVVPAPKEVKNGSAGAGDASVDAGDTAESSSAAEKYKQYNIVTISNGTVSVTEASCKNQVCVKHGAISKSGESIVCLPNRLNVRIQSGSGNEEGGGYDSITS